ncbi:hypothetical protein ACFV1A_01580 [Streptomyces seoulensis]|uniref:DUF485 domain-containing protein n=1 Tax=Streptomyces seoulensis TaxID=73044 RepID=A0A4P6U2C4_STRSO|nr:hypothetical protein [Streptomyces seoulensis]QBJ93352.1 hypothetical protein D0Z67_25780 [Streptomyces seoulensis]
MGAQPTPRREVVTGAPAGRTRAGYPDSLAHDDVVVRKLMRRQMRVGLVACSLLALPLGLFPLLFRLLPAGGVGQGTVWLLLGVAPYPVLLATGAWYVRRAERNEGDVSGR